MRKRATCLTVVILGISGIAGSCVLEHEEPYEGVGSSALSPAVADVLAANGETVVYESIKHHQKATPEAVVVLSETGSISNPVFQRYARPFNFTHEDTRYNFTAWRNQLEDGTIEEGVRVTSADTGSAINATPSSPTQVDQSLLLPTGGDAPVRVLIRIRDFPEWDIPLVPAAETLGLSAVADAIDAREEALQLRADLFDLKAGSLEQLIVSLGGTVLEKRWSIGWFDALIPPSAVGPIGSHPSLQLLARSDAEPGTAANRQDFRGPQYMGTQKYWDSGQFGDEPNPNNGVGAISIAIVEAGPVKDEARAFCNDAACAGTKFHQKWNCSSAAPFYCQVTPNYSQTVENMNGLATDHATTVASAAVADFLDGQIAGQTAEFNLGATSGPREAKLITFGALRGFGYNGNPFDTDPVLSHTILLANAGNFDIITGGTFLLNNGDNSCTSPSLGDVVASNMTEQEAENAFDSGAFIAISPGNYCGPSQAGFVSSSPAGIPKVFTVTGLNPAGCFDTLFLPPNPGDYQSSCLVDQGSSIRGGGPAKVGSTTTNSISVVDLAVPQRVTHFSRCTPNGLVGENCLPVGKVVTNGGDVGTSFAAPRLAGLAALAKDYFISTNQASWFDNPGWLHTYMVGQGDAHYSVLPSSGIDTTQADKGADTVYGMGRVKMRHPNQFGVYGHDFRSFTFTSTNPVKYFVGNVPLHANAELLKCVFVQHEDMSSKDDIAWVTLQARLVPPSRNGTCYSKPAMSQHGWITDSRRDTKHMVAFRSDVGSVGGYCAEITIIPNVLPSNGSVWGQAFCYSADEHDDEPH